MAITFLLNVMLTAAVPSPGSRSFTTGRSGASTAYGNDTDSHDSAKTVRRFSVINELLRTVAAIKNKVSKVGAARESVTSCINTRLSNTERTTRNGNIEERLNILRLDNAVDESCVDTRNQTK